MPRPSNVVPLCEDDEHSAFVRSLLIRCGIERSAIRVNMSPSSRGDGSRFVRENLLRELRACRQRSKRAQTWLIAITDADDLDVGERLSSLSRVMTDAGEPPLSPEEPVSLLVPKRRIETWIWSLLGNPASEEDTFTLAKKAKAKREIKQAAMALSSRIRDESATGLPSLDRARIEILRLLDLGRTGG